MDRRSFPRLSHSREIRVASGEGECVSALPNRIRSGKYSWATFVPLTLAEVLIHRSTLWFLSMAALEWNAFGLGYQRKFGTTVLFVLYIATLMFKTVVIFQQHRSTDNLRNNLSSNVWSQGEFRKTKFGNLKVGDVVLLSEGEIVPSDLILLSSSSHNGVCHFSTQCLFGESDLVAKSAVPPTFRLLQKSPSAPDFHLSRLSAVLSVEAPSADFASLSGSMKLPWLPRTVPLKPEHFVLRGGRLCGAQWALGILVYAGMETKFWSNIHHTAVRSSAVETCVNSWIFYAAAAVLAISGLNIAVQVEVSSESLLPEDCLIYVLTFTHIVPITLYLALTVLRVIDSLQSRDSNELVNVNPCALMGDLGLVEYVLADKTGTLTLGQLELVAVLVGSEMYTKNSLFHLHRDESASLSSEATSLLTANTEPFATFEDFRQRLETCGSEELQRFCECVALCSNVITCKDGSTLAMNADEEALIQGGRDLGFELFGGDREHCEMAYFNKRESFRVLCVKSPSRDLKRMRVLVQRESHECATLYVKGSYHALKPLLKLSAPDHLSLQRTLRSMEQSGLRTLVFCYRTVQGEYLKEVKARALDAMLAKVNSNGKREVLFQELEKDLTFLGATGVVDHTSPGVRGAVDQLRKAGVKTMVMSGEGESKTLAAAYDIGLIDLETEVVSVREVQRSQECQQRLISAVKYTLVTSADDEVAVNTAVEALQAPQKAIVDPRCFALSIDGESFDTAVRRFKTRQLLLLLLLAARTVCFFSLSPAQKRAVVKLMRQGVKTHPIVLCVGDDINDLPMLLEADVIAGIDHPNIQHACDISVCSFSRLVRLLLNEGRMSSFLRLRMTLLFLYSQALFAFVTNTFVYFADFTPYSPVSMDAKVMFGSVFTFLPLLLVGAIGLKATDAKSEIHRKEATKKKSTSMWLSTFAQYSLLTISHYIVICIFLFSASIARHSSEISTTEQGFLYLFALVCVTNLHCAFEVHHINAVFIAAEVLSTGAAIVYFAVLEEGLIAVLRSPRLVLGLVGAVLGGLVVSVGKWVIESACCGEELWEDRVTPERRLQASKVSSFCDNLLHPVSQLSLPPIDSNPPLLHRVASFESSETESEYQRAFLAESAHILTRVLVVGFIYNLAQLILELGLEEDRLEIGYQATVVGVVLALLFIYSVQQAIIAFTIALFAAILIATFTLDIVFGSTHEFTYMYVMIYLLLFLRENIVFVLPISAVSTLLFAIAKLVQLLNNEINTMKIVSTCIIIVAVLFTQTIAGFICFYKATQRREKFIGMKLLQETITQNENILACLLPEFVRKRVIDGIRYIAEDEGEVSIIFIDICHFDQICASYAPQELTALLDDIFQKIDEMCASLHVAKIETVGKTYLACAGLRDYEFEEIGEFIKIPHAKRCLDLAFAVLSSFRSYKLQSGLSLEFKIGINTGEVVAGVVGFHKPQFSLVGDTVNTGSRMCTTLEHPNTVQISESAYFVVKQYEQFQFQRRKLVVKGKGEMTTYIVTPTSLSESALSALSPRDEYDESEESANSLRLPQRKNRGSLVDYFQELFASSERVQVSLKFWQRSQDEAEFAVWVQSRDLSIIRFGMVLHWTWMFGLGAMQLARRTRDEWETSTLYSAVAFLGIASGASVCCIRSLLASRLYPWLSISLYIATVVTLTISSNLDSEITEEFVDISVGFLYVLLFYASGLLLKYIAVCWTCVIVSHLLLSESFYSHRMKESAFFFLFGLQHFIVAYYLERFRRKHFYTSKIIDKEILKTEQLLTQMIPAHAFEGLKSEGWTTDVLAGVSILYADIAGFTAWSSKRLPQEVIGKLSKIFTQFDKVCVEKQLYKVHTIGDCYVALSSTSNSDKRDPAEECASMVSFALEMVSVTERTCDEDHEHLKMRIGVHVGDVIAGITGSGVVRYDIYGPDVLVANKMESSGKEGRVNISAEAKRMLEKRGKDEYLYEFNKNVEVQEVGRNTDCFFVSRQ